MRIYAKVSWLGAIHIELSKEFGLSPLYSFSKYKNEPIIDLPFVRVILTPAQALKIESNKKTMGHSHSNDATKATQTLLKLLYTIQKVDAEFPIQYAICLAEISMNEGCSLTSLAEKTNLALSTVSRIIGALSDFRQRGTPYGFIEVRVSATERRRKELYLTDAGRKALKDFQSPLE